VSARDVLLGELAKLLATVSLATPISSSCMMSETLSPMLSRA